MEAFKGIQGRSGVNAKPVTRSEWARGRFGESAVRRNGEWANGRMVGRKTRARRESGYILELVRAGFEPPSRTPCSKIGANRAIKSEGIDRPSHVDGTAQNRRDYLQDAANPLGAPSFSPYRSPFVVSPTPSTPEPFLDLGQPCLQLLHSLAEARYSLKIHLLVEELL